MAMQTESSESQKGMKLTVGILRNWAWVLIKKSWLEKSSMLTSVNRKCNNSITSSSGEGATESSIIFSGIVIMWMMQKQVDEYSWGRLYTSSKPSRASHASQVRHMYCARGLPHNFDRIFGLVRHFLIRLVHFYLKHWTPPLCGLYIEWSPAKHRQMRPW